MTPEIPTFTAAIFDLDGLLIDSERIYRTVWQTATRRLGFELSDELHLQLIGRGRKGAIEKCLALAEGALEEEHLSAALAELDTEIFSRTQLPVKAGAVEILSELKERGMPIAVASSTVRTKLLQRLNQTGLDSYLSAIVAGDEVSRGKPNPDIFLLAAERLIAQPSSTLVFEDSSVGIEAAQRGGFVPCLVPDICFVSDEVRKLAAFTFDSLEEARRVLL